MDDPLEAAEDALERATELPDETALSVLTAARRDLRERGEDSTADEQRVEALEDQLTQRIREVSERDRYDAGMGSAMNPDEEDAP